MASFVPSLSKVTDIDSSDWHGCVSDDVAPDTVRSPGFGPSPTLRPGLFAEPASSEASSDDDEPPTLRADEIGAIAPRATRTFDPAAYVTDATVRSPNKSGTYPALGGSPAEAEEIILDALLDAQLESSATAMRSRIGGLVHKLGVAVERFVAA